MTTKIINVILIGFAVLIWTTTCSPKGSGDGNGHGGGMGLMPFLGMMFHMNIPTGNERRQERPSRKHRPRRFARRGR